MGLDLLLYWSYSPYFVYCVACSVMEVIVTAIVTTIIVLISIAFGIIIGISIARNRPE